MYIFSYRVFIPIHATHTNSVHLMLCTYIHMLYTHIDPILMAEPPIPLVVPLLRPVPLHCRAIRTTGIRGNTHTTT